MNKLLNGIFLTGLLSFAWLSESSANVLIQDVQSGSSVIVKTTAVRVMSKDDDRGRKDICRSGQCQRKKVLPKTAATTSLSVQARKLLTLGDQQYKAKKYTEALAAYQKSIKLKPSYEAYFGLGEAYSEIDKDAEASQAYTQSIKLNPKLGEAYYNLGVMQYEQGQYEAALKSFQQSVTLGTPDSNEYLYLGSTFRNLKRHSEAEINLRKSLQLNPKNGEIYMELGKLRYQEKKYEESLAEFRKAAELMPNNANVYLNIDDVLFEQDKNVERLQYLLKALQLKPELKNQVGFSLALSGVYRQNNKQKESLEWADAAIKIDPKNAQAYYFKTVTLLQPPNIRAAEAIEAANKSIALDPQKSYAYYYLGIGYLNSTPPNYTSAVQALTKAAELIPNEGDVYTKLAIAHFQKTPPDLKEVVQAARRAVQINPQDSMAHFFLGNALAQLSQNDQAVISLKEAVRLDPNLGAGRSMLCVIFSEQKKHQEAISECQQAIKTMPPEQMVVGHFALGLAYQSAKRTNEAKIEFETAIKLNPNLPFGYFGMGSLYESQKKLDKAIEYFERAVKVETPPEFANVVYQTHEALGKLYWRNKQKDKARRQFELLQNLNLQAAERLKLYMLTSEEEKGKKN